MKIDAVKTFEKIKNGLHQSSDFKSRTVQFFGKELTICFFPEITDMQLLNDSLIKPLTDYQHEGDMVNVIDELMDKVLPNNEIEKVTTLKDATEKLLAGFSLLLVDGANKILACNLEKITVRPIMEPPSSVVIKGPREGFNESIKFNLGLVRRRVKSKDLVVTNFEIGEITKTQVCLVYFDKLADKSVVKDIKKRLSGIKIDGIVDSHYLLSYLQKNPYSLFKQVGDVEKPDILVAKMLEGRVGIMVDGSPIVLTLPYILIEDLQNADDYYSQPIRMTFVRVLRLIGVVLAVLLPAFHVALQLYHYKIIPIEFLTTTMNTTKGIPFSPFIETMFIILLFEILYEANLRMPQYLGMAMSIVGALILGDTAVSAGLVSPPTVMIVALSGITFYIVPNQAAQFSILRLIAVFVGASLGIFGLLIFCVLILSYLASFDSYKSPYLAPGAPYIPSDQKDFFARAPLKDMGLRPRSIAHNEKESVRGEVQKDKTGNANEKNKNKNSQNEPAELGQNEVRQDINQGEKANPIGGSDES